ncbi:DUF2345 domain-containing protein, partial [Salmonella enterica subsp. enterica]|nr:DUF2345 domain-containing protein [Salmonella enterica subsp. enterica]
MLDPTDVTIVSGDANTAVTESGKGTEATLDTDTEHVFSPSATGAQVSAGKISEQLNAGTNVTVQTSGADTDGQSGNITVNADISKSAGADATLTLLADNSIATANNIGIGSVTGELNLNLLAGATTNDARVLLGNNINISLNGGDFYAGAGKDGNNVSLAFNNNGKIQAGNIAMNVAGGLEGYAYGLLADNDLTINGPVSGTTGWNVPLTFSAGNLLTLNSPITISLLANDATHGGGRVVINGDKGVSLSAGSEGITLQAANAATNNVTVTSANGAVSIAAGGNISLKKDNISAKGDVTLQAGHGSISISGTSATAIASIISDSGNINITGNVAGLGRNDDGVLLNDTTLLAKDGKIKVKGTADGLNSTHSTGGVRLGGGVTFNSTLNTIDGTHVNGRLRDGYGGVVFNGGNFNFINDTVINAIADSYAGLLFDVGYSTANLNFRNGSASIVAENEYKSRSNKNMGGVVIVPYTGKKQSINFNMDKADLNISVSAVTAGAMVSLFPAMGSVADSARESGYVFSGNGNVNINATSDSGYGVELRVLNNVNLEG